MSVSAERRAELERWLAGAAFNSYDHFRVGALGAGECTIEAPYRDEFVRPGGGVSGPVFTAAADVAIYLAIATRRGAHERWVTVDLKTAFLRAAVREPFTCRARVRQTDGHVIMGSMDRFFLATILGDASVLTAFLRGEAVKPHVCSARYVFLLRAF